MSQDVSVALGQKLTLTLIALQADGTAATGAVIVAPVVTLSDFTLATTTVNADNSISFAVSKVGVATVTVSANVTDTDGVTTNVQGTGTLTVTAGAGDVRTASLQLNWAVV